MEAHTVIFDSVWEDVTYVHHPTNKAGVSNEVSQAWHQILQSYGYESQFTGAVTEEVLDYLTQQGLSLKTVTVAEFPRRQALSEILQTYQDRIYSNLWRVPDEIYPQALHDLQTWAEQQFDSLEVTLESRQVFTLTAAYDQR